MRSHSRQQSVLEMPASFVAFGTVARFVYVELVPYGDTVAFHTIPRLAFTEKQAMVT